MFFYLLIFMTNIFKSKKNILIIIVMVIIGVGLVFYFTRTSPPAEIEEEEEAVSQQPVVPEDMKAGEVGEIGEGKSLAEVNPQTVTSPLRPFGSSIPAVISDTKGEIISIGEEGIIVRGSGENFEDQKPRDLAVKFTNQTRTFEKGQNNSYVGLESLKYLEIGQRILISSSENIRGKTEFLATYINKI